MPRWWSCAGASALIAGSLTVGAPGLATACACGAIVSPDSDARVADEEALVTADGLNETVVMRLGLSSTANNTAVVVPTPQPALVAMDSAAIFDDLSALSAPRIETRRNWSIEGGGVDAAAPQSGAPTVLQQVQLGPLEATTFAGGDVAGIQEWLGSHGYTMRPEVVAQLDPYLKEGWSFVAMRLTGAAPLNGQLPPVRLMFASDRLVYPMRMSAAARTPQKAVIYTLGEHHMERIDSDAAKQRVSVDYAGSIANREHDKSLIALARHGAYLTRISVEIDDPSAIATDFEFGPAPNDDPYQTVAYREVNVDLTLLIVPAVILVAVVAAIVVLVIRLRRRRKRRLAAVTPSDTESTGESGG